METKGTTSAYAEKRPPRAASTASARNYLRIRGEEYQLCCSAVGSKELPPHTRRRAHSRCDLRQRARTTSAYAEKRHYISLLLLSDRNYLRIRGEES